MPMSQLERRSIIDVPLYGQIAAGYSETTEQENQGLVSIDDASIGLRRGQKVFALKVRGDSMIGAGIYHVIGSDYHNYEGFHRHKMELPVKSNM